MTIGNNIKKLRTAQGLTQDQLAERLFVTRQTISSWERSASHPSLEQLEAIAAALGEDVMTLLAAVLLSAVIALPAAGQKCLLPAGLTWQQVTDSAQMQSQLLDATLGADGLLTLSYSVSAWGIMHALGAERIVIWRQVDETSWVEALRYDETTSALWTPEGQHHSGQVRYQGWPATAYRVEVTLFAENDQGRDSRTWSKELRP